jgi:hypothetical protein
MRYGVLTAGITVSLLAHVDYSGGECLEQVMQVRA